METDHIGVCELLVGLSEVNVWGVDDVAGEPTNAKITEAKPSSWACYEPVTPTVRYGWRGTPRSWSGRSTRSPTVTSPKSSSTNSPTISKTTLAHQR